MLAPSRVHATAVVSVAPRQSRRLGRLLVPTAAVAALAAVLWWITSSNPEEKIRAEARTAALPEPAVPVKPARGPVAQEPNPVAPDPSIAAAQAASNAVAIAMANQQTFNSVKVQAIFYRPSNPSVMINGKTVGLHERINGLEVVAISQTNVVLAVGAERKEFQVKSK